MTGATLDGKRQIVRQWGFQAALLAGNHGGRKHLTSGSSATRDIRDSESDRAHHSITPQSTAGQREDETFFRLAGDGKPQSDRDCRRPSDVQSGSA